MDLWEYGTSNSDFIMLGVITFVGIIASIIGQYSILKKDRPDKEFLLNNANWNNRITEALESIRNSAGLVRDIEKEIEHRKSIVEKLQKDIEIYKGISELSKGQLEAAALFFSKTTEEDNRRTFWKGAFLNFFFFVLGVIIPLLIQRVLKS